MRPAGLVLGLLLAACGAQQPPSATPTPTAIPSPTAPAEPSPTPTAAPTPESRLEGDELAALVHPAGLRAHLEALQRAADGSGGTRATSTRGFAESVRYVTETLEAAGYTVDSLSFTAGGVPSTNLIVERRGRAQGGVVIVGAHLDSVQAGPGINDNGSGVAAVLVLAAALADLPDPDRTIRLAFWGAEEGGPFGSSAYVAGLTSDERDEIGAYLNFDMLGSPNAIHFVYDEDDAPPGSDALTALIGSHVEAAGLPWMTIDVDRRSDHGPFAAAGIPIGGIFSGGRELVTDDQAAVFGAVAGQPSDPCSDAPCDTIDNVDLDTLTRHTQVIAEVIASLAAAD